MTTAVAMRNAEGRDLPRDPNRNLWSVSNSVVRVWVIGVVRETPPRSQPLFLGIANSIVNFSTHTVV